MDPVAKMGRPPVYGGRATLDFMQRVRITRKEHAAWKREAKRLDKSVSEWLRDVANESIRAAAAPKLHVLQPPPPEA